MKREVTSPAQINFLSVSPQEMDMESPMFSTFKFKRPRKSHCPYSQTWEKSLLLLPSKGPRGLLSAQEIRRTGNKLSHDLSNFIYVFPEINYIYCI